MRAGETALRAEAGGPECLTIKEAGADFTLNRLEFPRDTCGQILRNVLKSTGDSTPS